MRTSAIVSALGFGIASAAAVAPAFSVEIRGMKDFGALHGRYAPGGDCQRSPRFEVDAAGMRFEVGGRSDQIASLEYAASFGGNTYAGSSRWFFPFGHDGNYPVLMTFNAGEKPGVVTIEPQDEGYPGGPALSARNQALVEGSPYMRCR